MSYFSGIFNLIFHKILMKRNPRPSDESHILNIPKIEAMIKFKWLCKSNQNDHYFNLLKPIKTYNYMDFIAEKLDIDLFLNMPKEEEQINIGFKTSDLRKIVKFSEVVFFYYNNQFVEWILNLPQLRHDMLNLYKINPQDYAEEEEKHEDNINIENLEKGYVKYSDYLELLKYALNIQLNKVDQDMNFFKLINQINLKMFVSGARYFNNILIITKSFEIDWYFQIKP